MQRIGGIDQRPLSVPYPGAFDQNSLEALLRIRLLLILEIVDLKNAILVPRSLGMEKSQPRPRPVDPVLTGGVIKCGQMDLAIVDAHGAGHPDARNGVRYIPRGFVILHMEDSVASPTDGRPPWVTGPSFRLGPTKHGIPRIASELVKTMFKPS